MTYQIAICDDEKADQDYLSMLVNKWATNNQHLAVVDRYDSAETFLFRYADHRRTDILLLDIEMGAMNGIELAQQIRRDNDAMQILFITGYTDFIALGYEVSALHYLMKPVQEEKLFAVLDKACKNLRKTERALLLNIGGEAVRIPVGSILYIEAFGHTVTITTTSGSYESKQPIAELQRELGDGFVRCHRSYIVGLKHIRRITKTDIVLDNDMTIPLARRAYHEVNQAFIHFFKGE